MFVQSIEFRIWLLMTGSIALAMAVMATAL
jgi:hypothetical protein